MRPKRSVRASGVGRSLGASQGDLIQCVCCGRWLPREAIAHIRRKSMLVQGKKKAVAFCGECWTTAAYTWKPWVVEEDE
jgi:hypothetical protein